MYIFRLGYFERKYEFFNQTQLNSEITQHYSSQVTHLMQYTHTSTVLPNLFLKILHKNLLF